MADRLRPLAPEKLRWNCPDDVFGFGTTAEIEPAGRVVGQDRAVRAVQLGLEITSRGYNMFVTGVSGTGRETTVERILDSLDLSTDSLRDILYLHNFVDPPRPVMISLPAGGGRRFSSDLDQCVDLLKSNIPAVMSSERMSRERRGIQAALKKSQQEMMQTLDRQAREKGFAIVSIPVAPDQARPDVLPLVEGQPVTFDRLETLVQEGKLTAEEHGRFVDEHEKLFNQLIEILRKGRKMELDAQAEEQALIRRTLEPTVTGILDRLKEDAPDEVDAWVDVLSGYLLENLETFLNPDKDDDPYYFFAANLLVDNADTGTRPVVIEQFPDQVSLFGSIDRMTVDGRPYSDFTMIRAGSLLRADGGYIIMDAMDVLRQPGLWASLMQVLRNRMVVIRPHDPLNLFPVELQPGPIEISVKVILLGSAYLYTLLGMNDPEFGLLFRIRADFDDQMKLSDSSLRDFADVIASVVRSEDLPPLSAGAMGALAEQGVRMAQRRDRISTEFSRLADYARQAAYWARDSGSPTVEAVHVRKAILEKRARLSMGQDYAIDSILRGETMVDTSGARAGQVNGLVVISGVDYTFGLPMRVTARVSTGREGVIDIEREADLSGAIHTKGVLIITGFLRGRFAREFPLSLSASLCIEQSYGGVEGDSASCAELYALMSALSGFPVRQDLAVTGSVNQHGEVQPIGGVNYKIEGFFNICRARGLTGTQGVLIPESNVDSLQLDDDVVAAVEEGRFSVIPVRTVDEGMEMLMGAPAGEPSVDGSFPPGTVNGEAEAALRRMASILRDFNRGS